MKIKKINAALSMLTTLMLFIHVGYTSYAYLTMYYNPIVKNVTSYPFMVLTCLHAVLAMCIIFFFSESSNLGDYPKKNVETIMQRVSGFLMLPLLILHINTFNLLQSCAAEGKWFPFVLLIISQVIFYAVVFTHTAVSFSRALITLGRLSSLEKKKSVDRIVYIVCAILFLASSIAVIKGDLAMFLPTLGGAA